MKNVSFHFIKGNWNGYKDLCLIKIGRETKGHCWGYNRRHALYGHFHSLNYSHIDMNLYQNIIDRII